MLNGASGRHSFPFPKIYPYPATVRKNTLPFSSFFALLPRSLFFQRTPLATEFRLEKCAAPHHSGNECFFFLFSFLPRIKVELIRQTSLQWFRASSWRKFFASRNRNCRNFCDFYDNRTFLD